MSGTRRDSWFDDCDNQHILYCGYRAISGARASITVAAFNEGQDAALLLRRRNPILVGRITVVTGADEGEYFPKIIRIFDDWTHGWHRPRRGNQSLVRVPFLLQFDAAQSDEPE